MHVCLKQNKIRNPQSKLEDSATKNVCVLLIQCLIQSNSYLHFELYGLNMCVTLEACQHMLDASKCMFVEVKI
jgi:hypothetical protein